MSPVPGFEHLYVHVPFCARRCTYCDFSIAVRPVVPVAEYLDGLTRELAQTGRPASPRTLYLGGGTPSKLGGAGIARLAEIVGVPAGLEEFTIEANPEDVTPGAVRDWVAAGVNRLSLGSQSFDATVLAWMHRTHDVAAIARAVQVAREGGVGNLSLDLIFALPESLGRDWRADLDRTIALEPDHVSLYGLSVEPGTPLVRQVHRGETLPPPDTRYAAEYLEAHEVLRAAGYGFYEVSNAARPGREAIHNRAYWRRVPYLGIGPSAHSFDGTARWWNEPAYAKWLELLAAGSSSIAEREVLGVDEVRLEELYLGLRTTDGIALWQDSPARLLQAAEQWVRAGWAQIVAAGPLGDLATRRLVLTPSGWLRLDELVSTI